MYVNWRLIIFICWQRGSEQLRHMRAYTHTHTHKEKYKPPIECLVITQLFFVCFVIKDRNSTKKAEGEGRERERETEIGLVAASSSRSHLSRIF